MFVGEVRRATVPFGSSWKLSGGSHWSSGPTKVSKKAQVLLASRRSSGTSTTSAADGSGAGGPAQVVAEEGRRDPQEEQRHRERYHRGTDRGDDGECDHGRRDRRR